jgi:DnaJ-class molecular chaperone
VRTTTDLYELLGVPREATQDDIRKAHRELVRRYHPDANLGDHSSEEHFKEVQRAYEVLSDPEKRREYDKRLNTSARRSSGKPRDLTSERSSPHKEGSFRLRGEEVARLAKFLGVEMSRISELLGKDITRLSKLVDENMKMNTRVDLGDARSGGYPSTDERVSDGKRSGVSNKAGKKKVKGPKAQRKVKRVRGPKAQRRRNNR